ncbi:MAG: AI-2E family transporter [Paracoccus sp. (in: a-proteobacteria)]|nr:AI-2E family transporter [Paracoccus sp. (in: a-proteobacteria)]
MEKSSQAVLRDRLQTGFLGIIALALVLFLLVQARFILIPLAIAIIVFSLTSDAIGVIARQGVPNWLATPIALGLIATGLLWLTSGFVAQVNEVVSTAITYMERAQAAIPELIEWAGPNITDTLTSALSDINLTGWMRGAAGQAGSLVSGSVLVILFVGFMFAERMFFPQKIQRLIGNDEDAHHVRAIFASIMRRVNRYLVVKTLVSLATALCIWAIFKIAGLELAGPVAVMTFVLNFIPSVGSIVATIVAVALAFAMTGDFQLTIIVLLACTAVQFSIGNVLDPMLLGQTLRLSSLGIILSLAFWGTLWGVPGMFLAVPIMVALMIACAHIPWLRGLAVVLSREGLPDDGLTDVPEKPGVLPPAEQSADRPRL